MRAMIPDGRGSVVIAETNEPTPLADEALVAVDAFSVNRGAVLPDSVQTDRAAALPLAGLTALRLVRVADADDLATLVRLVDRGHLHPEIGRTDPWHNTPAVLDALLARQIRGNAVLEVTS